MKKVRYEEMMSHEIVAVGKEKPVAYLDLDIYPNVSSA